MLFIDNYYEGEDFKPEQKKKDRKGPAIDADICFEC